MRVGTGEWGRKRSERGGEWKSEGGDRRVGVGGEESGSGRRGERKESTG